MQYRIIFLLAFLIISCNETKDRTRGEYVDLNSFFTSEARRLKQQGVKVDKTVRANGVSESRQDLIPDWQKELQLFAESDINKPAWIKSYQVSDTDSSIVYSALDSGLRTRSISIKKDKDGHIREINISNGTSNDLYHTSEELTYIPDSMYRIIKHQKVIILGNNQYQITGILK